MANPPKPLEEKRRRGNPGHQKLPAKSKTIALAHPLVSPHLDGKTVKKTIVVPNRIINVVAA